MMRAQNFGEDFISSSFITVKAIDFDFIPKFRFWLAAAAYSAATNCRILSFLILLATSPIVSSGFLQRG